ncbi:unnamed protein product [Rhizopus stolonifer]
MNYSFSIKKTSPAITHFESLSLFFSSIVEQLLESYKPHLNPDRIRDSKLRTPLMLACMKGHTEVIKVLLRWGADVNNPMGDIVGNRPLHMAVTSNNFDAVLVLLEAGAKIRPEESETFASDDGLPSAIREKNLSTAPLDLATSKLNALMKQVNTRNRAHSMGQVLKIINLLKHYSSGKESVDLDELTKKISGMRIEPEKKTVGEDEDFLVMKNLKDVIEKMKIA